MTKKGLNAKQKRFCDHYIISSNAADAARKAGYSQKTARSLGQRLLTNVDVKAYIDLKSKKILDKLDLSAERTLLEIGRVAFQDVRQFYRPDGSLIPVHELSDDAAAVIAGIEVEETYTTRGAKKRLRSALVKIKRVDKGKALEMMAKHHKLYSDAPVNNFNLSERKVVFK